MMQDSVENLIDFEKLELNEAKAIIKELFQANQDGVGFMNQRYLDKRQEHGYRMEPTTEMLLDKILTIKQEVDKLEELINKKTTWW